MNILISGASGFIGHKLLSSLLKDGYNVSTIGRTETPGVKNYYYDLSKTVNTNIKNQLSNRIDTFFHLAWNGVNGPEKNDAQLQLNNLSITHSAIDLANSINCKIITLGSASEFALTDTTITEDTPASPVNAYGWAKAASRVQEKNESNNNLIQTVVGSIYGPGRNSGDVLSFVMGKLLSGDNPVINSDGEQLWNFIYIDDLIDALKGLSDKGEINSNYVIGSKNNKKIKDYLYDVKNIVNPKLDVIFGSKSSDNVILDTRKIYNDVGWVAGTAFNDGIKETIKWFKERN